MSSAQSSLVLASGSATRRALLQAAGLVVEVQAADVDEASIRDSMLASNSAVSHESIAEALAAEKAKTVSAQQPDALVIGADQVLSFEGRLFEKPKSIEDARAQLKELRGKAHALHSATALARNGNVEWRNCETATLRFRAFSDAALEAYIEQAGEVVKTSVGAYQIEGPAIQLFESIYGDHTTILGLPVLPLLAELRRREVIIT